MINQTTWNTIHGNLTEGAPGHATIFNGGHVFIILILLAPFYAIFQSPMFLLTIQALALGLGAWPLFLLGRKILGERLGLVFSLLYLIYPAMNYACLFEFHPVVLVTPLILGAAWALSSEKKIIYWILIVITLACREDAAIPVAALGIFALIQAREWKKKRSKKQVLIAIGTVLAAGIWFLICLKVIQPAFRPKVIEGTTSAQAGMAFFGWLGNSPTEILINLISHPGQAISKIFIFEKRLYFYHLLIPVSFLSLLSPAGIAAILIGSVEGLLSQRFSHYSIFYQYSSLITPLIFVSAIYGTRNLIRLIRLKSGKIYITAIILIIGLLASWELGPLPQLPQRFKTWRYTQEDEIRDNLVDIIPSEDPVGASFGFAPKLSSRPWLFYFYHIYSVSTHPNFQVEIPPARQKARWILVDFNDWLTFYDFYTPGGDRQVLEFLREGRWQLEHTVNSLALFKRGKTFSAGVIEPIKLEPQNFRQVAGIPGLEAGKVSLKKTKTLGNLTAQVKIELKCSKKLPDILFVARLVDRNNPQNIIQQFLYAPYRIYPTQRWQPGETWQLETNLLLPPGWENKTGQLEILALFRRPGITGLDPRLDTSMLLNYVPGKMGVSPGQLLIQKPIISRPFSFR